MMMVLVVDVVRMKVQVLRGLVVVRVVVWVMMVMTAQCVSVAGRHHGRRYVAVIVDSAHDASVAVARWRRLFGGFRRGGRNQEAGVVVLVAGRVRVTSNRLAGGRAAATGGPNDGLLVGRIVAAAAASSARGAPKPLGGIVRVSARPMDGPWGDAARRRHEAVSGGVYVIEGQSAGGRHGVHLLLFAAPAPIEHK